MIREVFKSLALMMSTAVAVPYTIAILCNILYGWPLSITRLKQALHLKKVYALNVAVLRQISLLKYISLYIRWKHFYKYVDSSLLSKNLPYGRNDRTLDLYTPFSKSEQARPDKPVVVYIFGGGWGSGDKGMFGLLCSQIAHQLKAIVCCPNYSFYPQGCVDDMIQDVVDCLSWIHENIHYHGGNKDKIMLIGHSSGAHLCAMSVLELLHDKLIEGRLPLPQPLDSMRFEESYFNGSVEAEGSSHSSESFSIISNNGEQRNNEGSVNSFEILNSRSEQLASAAEVSADTTNNNEPMEVETSSLSTEGEDIEEMEEDSDNDSVVTVRPKEIEKNPSLVDLCKSIKAVIGLAGVYHIGNHYQHEKNRGIEDLSCMARAMYGADHFDRFSPTVIIKNLNRNIGFPKMILVHGTADNIVPISSSSLFGEALSEIYSSVSVRVVPDCDHYSICLDLMSPERKHYDAIMGIIFETARQVL